MAIENYNVNELLRDRRYITKNKINSQLKNEYPFLKDIPLKDIKEIFDDCEIKVCKVGNPYNKYQQMHVKFVDKEELAQRVFRDYSRLPRQK